MKKQLSMILCVTLCVALTGAIVTTVIAAVQMTTYIEAELALVWAIAAVLLLPLMFMTGLGVWLAVYLIRNIVRSP